MLIAFFVIVFIAEMIVAEKIISVLRLADERVCKINSKVCEFNPVLKGKLSDTHTIVSKILSYTTCFIDFVLLKKCECEVLFKKNLITTILCLAIKMPYRKIFDAVSLFFTLKKLLKK